MIKKIRVGYSINTVDYEYKEDITAPRDWGACILNVDIREVNLRIRHCQS